MKTDSKAQATKFYDECVKRGFDFSIKCDLVTISKKFVPNDKAAFSEADMFAYGILELAPLRGGSVWGTDGGSVGGYVGLKNGEYVLNKSGSGTRFLNALKKISGGPK